MTLTAAAEGHYDIAFFVLIFASAGVLHHSGIKIPFYGFFGHHDSGIRVKEAPWNMLLAMGISAFLCVAIGVYPQPLYDILPYPVDFELGNWFASTHPQSPFVRHVIVQQRTAETRYMLRDLVYVEHSGGVDKERTIERRELVPLLREVFGIYLEPDVTLRALDTPERIAQQ